MRILFYSSYFYPYISGLVKAPLTGLQSLTRDNITVLTFPHKKNLEKTEKLGKIMIRRMSYLFKISKGYISPQSSSTFWHEVKKSDKVILNLPNFEALLLAVYSRLQGKRLIALYNCRVILSNNLWEKTIVFFLNISVFLQLLLSDQIIAYPDYLEHLGIGKIFKKKVRVILPPLKKPPINTNVLNKFLKTKKDEIWLGFAGRIAREKGVEYLIEAIKVLEKSGRRIRVIFAGPTEVAGERPYFTKIKSLITSQKIPHLFLGQLTDADLGAFYKSLDILILPSTNETEAFGLVQIEAMACGTPVIASNLPGVRFPIKTTGGGILVRPKSAGEIVTAVQKILKNREKYRVADKKTLLNLLKNKNFRMIVDGK